MFFYTAPKDNDGFAIATCYDWSDAKTKIDFDELVIEPLGDDGYLLCFHAQNITDIKKTGADDWAFPKDSLVAIAVHKKEYKQYSKRDKKEITKQPSAIETYFCQWIDENCKDELADYFYKGQLNLSDNPSILDDLISGKDAQGEPLDATLLERLHKIVFAKWVKEKRVKLKYVSAEKITEILKEAKTGSNKTYQSQYQRCDDTFQWVVDQVKKVVPHYPIEGMYDLTMAAVSESKLSASDQQRVTETVSYCLLLIGGKGSAF